MTKYKRVDAKNGRTMWFVNGDMTSAQEIPLDVIRDLQSTGTLEIDDGEPTGYQPPERPVKQPPVERICIVDGEPGTHSKYAQGITVYLCDAHYGKTTTGELVALMREKELI